MTVNNIEALDPLPLAAEVLRLAQENPDFVYKPPANWGCSYLGNRCIVGQAAHNLGVSDDYLSQVEGVAVSGFVATSTPDEQMAMEWLRTVQGEQDCAVPWGQAVSAADDSVRNFEIPSEDDDDL